MRTVAGVCVVVLLAACAGDPSSPGGGTSGEGGTGTSGTTAAGTGAGAGSRGGAAGTGTGGTLVMVGGMSGGTEPVGGSGTGGTLGEGGCGPVNSTALCSNPAMGGSPPPPPKYSGGTCPKVNKYSTAGGSAADSVNTIMTATGARTFFVVAPDNPCPGETFPVIFMWHWIGGKAQDWIGLALPELANQYRFIAVMADGVREPFKWPFTALDGPVMESEYKLFDDMYACVSEQFPTNPSCVATVGVSAGGLFTSQLMQGRGQYFSSSVVISGGTGVVVLPFLGAAHKMPTVAFWGGPKDNLAGFSFDVLMKDLEAGLQRDGHYFIECVHNCGHAPPLLDPPMGGKHPLDPIFDFLLNHPYGLAPGASPYKDAGKIPDSFPAWCSDKGLGTAPPANITNCPSPLCAAPDTPIATPTGERPIAELKPGDLVYSVDHGAVVAVPLARIGRTAVTHHHVVEVKLANGRVLEVSGGHPCAEARTFADLAAGSLLDGVEVRAATVVPYPHAYTHDILPASDTGTYFAAGVRIGSTLFDGAP